MYAPLGAFEYPPAGVRKAAVRALPRTDEANQAILDSGVLDDEDSRTRLAAILTTIKMPSSPEIGETLYELSQEESVMEDKWLAEALKLAADKHQDAYREASTAGQTGSADQSGSGESQQTVTTEGDVQKIRIEAVMDELQFSVSNFTVEAGKKVEITFYNPDFMQHNMLIVEKGALEKVGEAADDMMTNMDAAEKNYVPEIPEVLYSTRLLNPEETVTLSFTAPEERGDYPYVCTFPGHWRTMKGTMTVTDNMQAPNL
jgi:azurin